MAECAKLESDSSTKCCLICTVPIHFTRLGIHACRACASFYKRATITGKKLICRRGDNQCVFRKHEKFMCRRCRFDKCVAHGMEYTEKSKEKEGTGHATQPSTSNGPETLLDKIKIEYDICCYRRRLHELAVIKKHNLERVPNNSEEVYFLTFASLVESSLSTAPELLHFFQAVFPSINELSLSEEDQLKLYRNCITPFAIAEQSYNSKRIWGRLSNYFMSTLLMGYEGDDHQVWAGPQGAGPLRNELLALTRAYIEEQKRRIIPVFEYADLTEKEFLALLPLLLIDAEFTLGDVAAQYQPVLDTIRSDILKDLHRFYTKEMGLNDYSPRLGNLLVIANIFREADVLLQEFLRMQVTIFDVYKAEKLLQNLVL